MPRLPQGGDRQKLQGGWLADKCDCRQAYSRTKRSGAGSHLTIGLNDTGKTYSNEVRYVSQSRATRVIRTFHAVYDVCDRLEYQEPSCI